MDSIEYYSKYANIYFEKTVDLNMEVILDKFIELLPEGATVLDLGCGSGRDSFYLIEKGFDVTALDGSKQLCELAEIHIGQDVLNMRFEDIDFEHVFDGIWACASLLHIKAEDIDGIMDKIIKSLKMDGILYMSFKYGEFSGIRNERYFEEYNTRGLKELISRHKELQILDMWKSNDIRIEMDDDVWIHAIVKKINIEEQE